MKKKDNRCNDIKFISGFARHCRNIFARLVYIGNLGTSKRRSSRRICISNSTFWFINLFSKFFNQKNISFKKNLTILFSFFLIFWLDFLIKNLNLLEIEFQIWFFSGIKKWFWWIRRLKTIFEGCNGYSIILFIMNSIIRNKTRDY